MEQIAVTERGRSYIVAVPSHEQIAQTLRSGRIYEIDLLGPLSRFVSPGDLVVDVGANIGNHTLYFALICGSYVQAFEPNPTAAAYLERNVVLNDMAARITVHRVALGDHDGHATMRNSNLGIELGEAQPDEDGDIVMCALDNLRIGRPRLLKVDVEGAELSVLHGAQSLIGTHRPIVVVEAKTVEALAGISDFLTQDHGYVRFPLAFAWTPTFVFFPRRLEMLQLLVRQRIAARVIVSLLITSHRSRGVERS